MQVKYKGHEINVIRDKCMAGYELLYFSIFRIADGFVCEDSFTSSADTVREMVAHLKRRIDRELQSTNPWGES